MIQQIGRRCTLSFDGRNAFQRLIGQNGRKSQCRYHHPNPFDPKTTKGWKAALKVNNSLFVRKDISLYLLTLR
jgi:hypothetical protein